ncbi:MAG: hypothetical protein R3A47_05995 [Polyangiales bacterium]
MPLPRESSALASGIKLVFGAPVTASVVIFVMCCAMAFFGAIVSSIIMFFVLMGSSFRWRPCSSARNGKVTTWHAKIEGRAAMHGFGRAERVGGQYC